MLPFFYLVDIVFIVRLDVRLIQNFPINNVVENSGEFVDKKLLLSKSLAGFMKIHLPSIFDLVSRYPQPNVKIKSDGTQVTDLDLHLSSFIEDTFSQFKELTFYSEEKYSAWKFPLLALDPLDGTREYVEGRNEWAISIGLFSDNNFSGEGWVFNPKTDELFERASYVFEEKNIYEGEVSRSEWKKGLYKNKPTEKFNLKPVGSIAYKLGRLSQGKCDFVVSLQPKNIWDIAGGTLLCHEAGIKLYSKGKEVTEVLKHYESPLIWCHPSLFPELSRIYC